MNVEPLKPRTAPLVGMIGKKRAGKDTFAATLVEGFGYTRVAFADPMKAAALALDPIVEAHLEEDEFRTFVAEARLSEVVARDGWEKAKEIPEVRRFLQRLGTEAIRDNVGDGVWVEAAFRKISSIEGPVVVTDVRFPNEAAAIEAAGGVLVRVTRPGLESTDTHASETALDDYPADYTVRNSKTPEDLAVLARLIADDLA